MTETEVHSLQNKALKNEISNISSNFNTTSSLSNFRTEQQGVYDQINQLFTEQDQQQRKVQETRDILGDSATSLTDTQIYDLTNEVQYLVDTWLEEFEKKVFEGKTLKDLLKL